MWLLRLGAILGAMLLQAQAGELCNVLDEQGHYAAGDACRIDESEAQMHRAEMLRQQEVDRLIRDSQRRSDEIMQQLLLEDRLRSLERR